MSNSLANVIPKLLAQGLLALRENAVMPLLVNRGYEVLAGNKGSTIEVPVPSAIAVADVTPGHAPTAGSDSSPTAVSIPLDQWKEATFYLTDKDIAEVMTGTIPMQASEAIKALANWVDGYIMGLYLGVYGYIGTAGTTPFASTTAQATGARKTLNNQLAPLDDRRFVIDADAEANALDLRAFQDASWAGTIAAIEDGKLNRKLGFQWFMDQNVVTHTAGTGASATTDATGYALGVKTVTLASAGTGTVLVGDIITFAGDTQTYAVTAGDADVSGGGTLSFEPGLKVAIATSATAITLKATHVVNLAFHRDAFAFASRPLTVDAGTVPGMIQSAVDPVTGLALRLEVTRQHKQTKYSFDLLCGGQLVRRELACRVAG